MKQIKGYDEAHSQAEPHESRWALAAAGAAACAATACEAGGEGVAAAEGRQDAIARYEAVLDGDAGCVEALQQLALLCAAKGTCTISDREALQSHNFDHQRFLHEPLHESAVKTLMQDCWLYSAGQPGLAEAYSSRLRRLSRCAVLAPATALQSLAQTNSSWPCGALIQPDTARRSMGLVPAVLSSR